MNQRRRLPDPRSDAEIKARMNELEQRLLAYEERGPWRDSLYRALSREWFALRRELTHRHAAAEALTQDDGSDPC